MHLELVRLGQVDLGEEGANVVPLVALQLDHLAILWMLHHCAVAGEFLFTSFDNLLLIVIVADALHRGEGFSSASLLDPNVN